MLTALPFAINTSVIKIQIEQKISQKLGVNFQVAGKVNIRFLPIPQISLKDTIANNIVTGNELYTNINVDNLIIRPNIFSLLKGKITIDSLIFENPKIENRYINAIQTIAEKKDAPAPETSSNANGGIFNGIVDFKNSNKEIFDLKNIKSIKFYDGSFSKKNVNNDTTIEFTKINFVLNNQVAKQIFTIQGDFFSGDIPTNFKLVANIKNSYDSILTIQSPIINLIASGKFENSNIDALIQSNFSGKIDAEIINLKVLLNKYFSKDNPIYPKINASQPIKASANINDKNGKISIDNILIKSQIINGDGKIIADLSDNKPKINANFNFQNIDIDNIWSANSSNINNKVIELQNDIITKFISDSKVDITDENKSRIIDKPTQQELSTKKSVFNNIDFSANIKIKTAKYYNDNLENISLLFSTNSDGKIILDPFTADIPGGFFKASGTLEYENNIPKFIGKANIVGQNLSKSLSWLKVDLDNLKPNILSNYNFASDIISMPNFTFFNNLVLEVNDNKNIVVGDIKIDNSTNISTTSANLKVNYLNYDEYFTSKENSSKKNPYLSSGSLLNKLLWLNTISSNRNIYLLFDKLIYQGKSLDNQSFRMQFGQGYFKLSDIDIHSDLIDLKGSIDVDIGNNSPQFNLNISSNNFQYTAKNDAKNDRFKNQFFNLPSLDDFSGKIDLTINNLKLDDWKTSDLKISGKLKNGIVDFKNFNLKAYNGTATYKGSLVLKNIKTINGSLELLGIDNFYFLSDIFEIYNINGISNISAVVNASGADKAEFTNDINAKVKFISANVNIKGFGIYDLAAKMAQPQKYKDELIQPLKILYNPNSQTSFKDVAGGAEFKMGGKNVFNIKVSTSGINGVVFGKFDNKNYLNGSGNFIFISGNRQKQIPINLAINFTGVGGDINKNTNLNQVEQYLGLPLSSPIAITEPEPIKTPTNDNQKPIDVQQENKQSEQKPTQQPEQQFNDAQKLIGQ